MNASDNTPGEGHVPSRMTASGLEAARLPADAERLATHIVAAQLRALFADPQGDCLPADAIAGLRPTHGRWLEASLRHFERHALVTVDGPRCRFAAVEPLDALWRKWDEAMVAWTANDDHRAYLVLIDACIRNLSDILTGAVNATDVMFPESSMHLVEGIYKHNPIAAHFNRLLGEHLRAELAARAARGEQGLRLIEIGAGTGGTTATLLPMLRGFGDLVEEYCYTDLSKAFLLHAEETYQPEFPAIRTAIFDVGKPLALQSVEGNRYDVVIATNVLHATSNMRETMRNAKALLKRGGIVLINELSEWSWFNHFTFGMLDGWWLSEDQALRLPGCPCLSPGQWEKLLKLEGFKEIRFPAQDDHGLGQQIVAARSDGVVRQRLVPASAVARPAATAPVARPQAPARATAPASASVPATTTGTVDETALREACTTLFREMIGGALRMEPRELDPQRALEHYGLDSILVVQLTTRFRKLFPDVRSTLFFEVKSIDGLVRHFLEKDRAAVAAVLAERDLVGAAPTTAAPATAPSKPAARRALPASAPAAMPATAAINVAAPSAAGAVDASHDGGLREACTTLFREMIGGALRMEPRDIEAHRPLEQYGLDSILVVQLTTRFRKLFPDVRSTLFFEVQSVDGLVRHFLDKHRDAVVSVLAERGMAAGTAASPSPAAIASAPAAALPPPRVERRRFAPRRPEPVAAQDSAPAPMPVHAPAAPADVASAPGAVLFDVAIIGLSGRYPQSPDLERFWDNLSAGRSCIAEVPEDRWHWQDYYDPEKGKAGTSYSRWGGFIADIDKFDPLFFRIAPREAKKIDPQERLFLETSYHAIEDSGYTPQTLSPTGKVGVFVGVMNSRYTVQPLYYSVANRVSFLFDFSGPSFAVDSACSSSLTAIHLALDSLYGGLCDAAIAGGVSLIVDPQHMIELSALGMLSEGAACRSFGRNADGFVDAEGVGAVILKPLAQALRDGDHVHAVIKASALNAGGRTHGYTVPNPVAQAEVVSTALARASVASDDVSYLEAHGTGTALGDPIEVSGLTRAFRERARADGAAPGRHCAIGSLKSNIGHCESAAGIAGLTKILLQLRHRQLVPTLHADVVNEEIDFEATPFRLQRALAAWQPPVAGGREIPRIAGISSFGAGGANAHLVVQEAPARAHSRTADTGPWLVPLSARTDEQLQDRIAQLAAFLRREGADIDLASLAYTLQVGREAMDERIVLQVDSLDDLLRRLQALADGQRLTPEPQRGNVRKQRDFLAACRADAGFAARRDGWLVARDLASIAEHWAKGVEIDWTRLYGDVRPLRMPLPTYPFARERHWMAPQRTLGAGSAAAAKHPLLQRNTSTLRHPAYGVELKGDERFLVADAAGQRRLPTLLCLEMARAAIAEAYPDDLTARALRFEAIALDDEVRIEAGCMLQVTLLPDSDDALRFEIHSVEGDVERIHAQGLARFTDAETVAQADVERVPAQLAGGLAADAFRARLATLGLGDRTDASAARRVARTASEAVLEYAVADTAATGGWGLPPDLLAALIDGAAWLSAELGALPASRFDWQVRTVEAVRFHAPAAAQGYLVLRPAEPAAADAGTSRWDATVCDLQGRPAFDLHGLQLACVPVGQGVIATAVATATATPAASPTAAAAAVVAPPSSEAQPAAPAPVLPDAGRRIAFLRATPAVVRAPVPLVKPQIPALPAVTDPVAFGAASAPRPTIVLPSPGTEAEAGEGTSAGLALDADAATACIDLRALGDGVYALGIAPDAPTANAVDQLLQALDHVRGRADAKALLLGDLAHAFPPGDAAALDAAIAAGLPRALLGFPLPTIATLPGDNVGGGFLFAALCDFMVGAQDARYGVADPQRGLLATDAEADLLAARFSAAHADDLLHVVGVQSGQALVAKGWTFPVVERGEVVSTAVALAASIAAKPRTSLELLKARLVETLAPLAERLGREARPRVAQEAARKAAPAAARKRPATRAGLAVEMLSETVAAIRIGTEARDLSRLLVDLRATLDDLAPRGHAALVLRSDLPGFLPALDVNADPAPIVAAFAALQASLAAFPAPVLVAFEHDADGLGWLLGLSADACVHGARGHGSADALWRDPALLRQALPLFARRLGDNLARTCLFGGAPIDATALAAGAAIIADDAIAAALALAEASPLRAPDALQQWRRRRAIAVDAVAEPVAGERRAAPLPSSPAIETELRDNGVLVVRMADRDAKNMYSPALVRGLEEVFAHIDGCDDYRAVVLTGYDTYFACGGTRDSLLAIQQGAAKFTDTKVYQLPTSCRVPVIAAMQGHAIGGGWTLGMFADLCLFSAESRYISPYMQYGFTPGAGATLVFPNRLGLDLARDTLFTAREHTGSELRTKGLPHVCVPRAEVLPRALALADAIAARRREDAIAVKHHFSAAQLAEVEATYASELEMHDRSFVGRGDALQGVMQHFRDDRDTATASPAALAAPAPAAVASPPVAAASAVDADAIAEVLRTLLATELQMRAEDVDEDTQFVDLGLDSITGVTWIRKVNAEYGTKIEATKVYSHPTLRQFRDFVVALVTAKGGAAPAVSAPVAPTRASAPAPEAVVRVELAAPAVVATPQAAAGPTHDSEAELCAALKRMLAQELQMAEDDVDEHRQFVELGLDSISGVTWVRRINAEYGTKIEATKVYSHPTLAEFSRFVATSLPARPAAPSSVPAAPAITPPVDAPVARTVAVAAPRASRLASWRHRGARRSPAIGHDAIAVIGIAGQFPRAKTLDAFWHNIAGARECIDVVPGQRFDIERYFSDDISIPGTTNSRWMGVLDDCDAFDPLFFNIAPTEAEVMDPQQRLMLQNCWHAIENAAIDPRSLSGSRCGVFVGCGASDYHDRSREHRLSTQGFTGAAMSILAARIAYFLNLRGPCLSIDTACSSSLVAIATACDSLAAQNCDLALAGGVAVMAGPMMHVNTGQSAMLSVDGRCYAFDHRANGFVPSEGVGTVMLKRLADAERDGDIVHAVIRGWGVNQDGKTNGITAPNPVSQTRLMRAVYDRFDIDPADIQLIEAHGTGTKLGDPIEVEGLTQAFRHYTDKVQYCALGSVKGNVGHCLWAAGIAGVLKLVLALKHRQLPPAASFERLNPHIDLSESPFVVNHTLKPWPTNARGARVGVVSAFGFSGTNAHLVLEGAPDRAPRTRDAAPERLVLIPLSAKTPEQLQQRALDLADALEADGAPALLDVAYTLQIGRQPMEERCALLARTPGELVGHLRAFAEGQRPRGVHVGSTLARAGKLAFIGQDRELQAVLIETCLREGKLDKLAELWVDGVDLEWPRLYRDLAAGARPQRVEVPLYPFASERYWLEDAASTPVEECKRMANALHPLVHVNASTLRQQRYRSLFDGSEFFLRDHRVRFGEGPVESVLPGVAYLEMAAAAIADALADDAAEAAGLRERLVLSNIAWWRPLFVNDPTTVEIELGLDEGGAIVFEIVSGSGDARILHCQGEAGVVDAVGERTADASLLAAARRGERWEGDEIYAAFHRGGLHYGPAHRGLRRLSRTGGKVVAEVELPAHSSDADAGIDAFRMHPGVMDAVLQACVGFLPSLQALPQAPSVPFTLRSLTLHAPCPAEAVAVLTPVATGAGGAIEACDVSIFGPDGGLCIDIRGFGWRSVDRTRAAEPAHAAFVDDEDEAQAFDESFYRELLDSLSRQELSAEEAAELGLSS